MQDQNAKPHPRSGLPDTEGANPDSRTLNLLPIRGFHPGEYASSPHGCQARMLQALGESLSYDDLICYGGFAFRVQVHQDMCPSAGHPCCGFMCIENSHRASPWETQFFASFPWSPPQDDPAAFEASVRAAVRESLGRGIPVQYGSEEDGLIVGCAEDGSDWQCVHPYHAGGREVFRHEEGVGFAGGKWPWGVAVCTTPKPQAALPDPRHLLRAALTQATEMWNTERREAYLVGGAAYAHWLAWLLGVEAGTVRNPQAGMQGNGWCFDVLIHSRRVASRWLAGRADECEGRAAAQLRTAAVHCGQLVTVCMEGLASPWELAPGPDWAARWTSDLRREQIRRLEAARAQDQAVFPALASALSAMDAVS